MCGIVYAYRMDGRPARKSIVKRYNKQKERGKNGFGWLALDEQGKVSSYERVQYEHEMTKKLSQETSSHVLMHHRWPTSTINVPEAAHPIRVKHKELTYTWFVVHNGIISNDEELHARHVALGYVYTTEVKRYYRTGAGKVYNDESEYNDSEAFAIELARTLEGKQARMDARGPIAYIAIACKGGKAVHMYYGTNGGNPLTETISERHHVISSEGGEPINDYVCHRLDLATREVDIIPMLMETYREPKGAGYDSSYVRRDIYMDEEDYHPDSWEEYDERIATCRDHILDIEAEMLIAEDEGDWDHYNDLTIEREGIQEEMKEYARSFLGIH